MRGCKCDAARISAVLPSRSAWSTRSGKQQNPSA
jgi:hypothetical protein